MLTLSWRSRETTEVSELGADDQPVRPQPGDDLPDRDLPDRDLPDRDLPDNGDYLRRILNARVYDVAIETPLDDAPDLSRRLGNRLLLKREDLQEVFSFKLRGAYNKMWQLTAAERERGVIASSAGNHAQGVALAATHLGCRAVIVMPTTAPQLKVDAVAARGAEIVLHGESYSDAFARAQELMVERNLTFVHPFDDPDVIAGQGTIGMEILRQHGDPIHAIFVAIGGGGLIAGIAAYVKQVRPDIKVIGVQHVDSDAMAQSRAAGKRVALDTVGLFSDGTAVKQVGVETFKLVQQYVDDIVVVDTTRPARRSKTCSPTREPCWSQRVRSRLPARSSTCAELGSATRRSWRCRAAPT